MKKIALMLSLILLTAGNAASKASTPTDNSVGIGFVPGDIFYPVEQLVQDIEVEIAGIIGGKELKAKAITNNADEALKKAKKLAENNKSEKAGKLAEDYAQGMNRSRELLKSSGNQKLNEKMENISKNNQKSMEGIRDKLPQKARDALDRSHQKSKKNRGSGDIPEKGSGESPKTPRKTLDENKPSEGKDKEDEPTGKPAQNLEKEKKPSKESDTTDQGLEEVPGGEESYGQDTEGKREPVPEGSKSLDSNGDKLL